MTRYVRSRRSGKTPGKISAKTLRNGRAIWLAGAALSVLAGANAAQAQTWTGANSMEWFDPGNWTGGVPNSLGTPFISTIVPNPVLIGGPGAVSGSAFIGNLAGETGQVTVNGAGATWVGSVEFIVGHGGTGALTS